MAEAISRRIAVLTPGGGHEGEIASPTADDHREVNRNLIFVALVAALVFIGCCLFYVWSQHQIISLRYETSEAAREEQALLQENKRLRLELASLKAPGRIERMAQHELGLVAPQKEQLIIVR
ncbi:MAG TPA: cell division protein FtsL [Candidatus Acidoferrum sp.]|nr:cell division protein FtsL [Candidatus Acidoferrum sp.]